MSSSAGNRSNMLWLALTFTAFAAGAATSGQSTVAWPWSPAQDAVKADPTHHKILYEDANIRILEVVVAPGAKEESHTHQWSSVFLIDSFPTFKLHYQCNDKALCRHGKTTTIDRPLSGTPMPVVAKNGPDGLHYATNEDTIPFHGYKIEYKKLQFSE
ncbi:MAG: hypothetical protein QM808_11545 [Steroidobacteraceae bacterium]